MAPKRRQNFNTPGHAHELTFSTYRRWKALAHPQLADCFVAKLSELCATHAYDLWAYVVMPEHVHLLVVPRETEYRIQDFRSSLRKATAKLALHRLRQDRPNKLAALETPIGRHRFWQDGEGFDRNLWSNKAVWTSIGYIHRNPVRRGLCASPRDWPWSSAPAYEGEAVAGVTVCPLPPYRPDEPVFRAFR